MASLAQHMSLSFKSSPLETTPRTQICTPTEHTPSPLTSSMKTPGKCSSQLYYSHAHRTPNHPNTLHARDSQDLHTPDGVGSVGQHTQVTPQYFKSVKPTPNPFETGLVERLHLPAFSPNMFAKTSTPSSAGKPKPFEWSIEHRAVLHPADIDEMPLQQDTLSIVHDEDTEEQAQSAIDTFFSTQLIAPSPWTDSAKKSKHKGVLHLLKTPGSVAADSPMVFSCNRITEETATSEQQAGMHDVACQTALTLPVDFDLQKVLGEHYSHQQAEDANQEMLSTSTLRRKLFFQGEMDSPFSPVRSQKKRGETDCEISPHVSPVRCHTPEHQKYGHMDTPGSCQFSSSPIRTGKTEPQVTPALRRCSTAPDLMASPPLSPVGSYQLNTPGHHARPYHMCTPFSGPTQATPSSGRPTMPLDSPGMSPIVSINRMEAVTPDSSHKHKLRRKLPAKVPLPPELRPTSPELHSISDVPNDGHPHPAVQNYNDQDHSMELERDDVPFQNCQNQWYKNDECSSQETVPDAEDFELDPQFAYPAKSFPGESCNSQDTGYNTNSLQITNHDIGIHGNGTNQEGMLHTNLTTQFNSLPITSQDTGIDSRTDMSLCSEHYSSRSHPCLVSSNIVSGFTASKESRSAMGPTYFGPGALDEQAILKRAREVLGKNTTSYGHGGPLANSTMYHEGYAKSESDLASIDQRPMLHSNVGIPRFQWESSEQNIQSGESEDVCGGVAVSSKTMEKIALPSEIALQTLRRAGEDLAKYCTSNPCES